MINLKLTLEEAFAIRMAIDSRREKIGEILDTLTYIDVDTLNEIYNKEKDVLTGIENQIKDKFCGL